MIVVRVLIVKCRKGEYKIEEMIREKGGEDGSRCGYTKEETGERERCGSVRILHKFTNFTRYRIRLRNVIKSMECPLV